MPKRKIPIADRSTPSTVTLDADGPWTMQGPNGVKASGGKGPIVITFGDPTTTSSTLAAIIIDPDPGGGGEVG